MSILAYILRAVGVSCHCGRTLREEGVGGGVNKEPLAATTCARQ